MNSKNNIFDIEKFCAVFRLRINGKSYRPPDKETEDTAERIVLNYEKYSDLLTALRRQLRRGAPTIIYQLDTARSTSLFDCENLLHSLYSLDNIIADYCYSQLSRSFYIRINPDRSPDDIGSVIRTGLCALIAGKLGDGAEILTDVSITDKTHKYHCDLLIRSDTEVSSLNIRLSPVTENDSDFRRQQTQRLIRQILRKNTERIKDYYIVPDRFYTILPDNLKRNVRSMSNIEAFVDELK